MAYTINTRRKLLYCWRHMMERCYKKETKQYKDWGGRGIKVCERWKNFENFYNDNKDFALPGLQIDRINNDGDYGPSNCRWTTAKEQALNRRSNRWIEYKGEVKSIYQWAKYLGIKRTTITQRLNVYGWTIEEAFTPVLYVRKEKRL